ncbi:ParA family protein [Salinivibrio socompensis]|uniref:ParA family protein n=1 Tax=Salinivibrio socompensis TaxID=1510206 RepID=UPI00046EBE04|nr:ParA family protein [Salinivibrio socompensis]
MIISIAHNKGGVGKTTTTLNLAAVLKPALVVDQDAHQGLAIINRLRDKPLNVVTRHNKAELLSTLRDADERGDLVLVDCGGFDSDTNRTIVAVSDLVIVPANDDVTELIGLRRFDDILSEINEKLGTRVNARVLFNRVHHARKHFEDVESFLNDSENMQRLTATLPQRRAYSQAMNKGLGVTEYSRTKYSDATRDVKKLCDEINAIITQ